MSIATAGVEVFEVERVVHNLIDCGRVVLLSPNLELNNKNDAIPDQDGITAFTHNLNKAITREDGFRASGWLWVSLA